MGWVWTLNWNAVRDDLVVGSCPMETADIDSIHAGTGATAILSVQHDDCLNRLRIDYAHHTRHGGKRGLAMVRRPMRDFDPPDQRRYLPRAVRALAVLQAAGHRTYVHCTAGINRAPLTVLAYLTFIEGQHLDDALAQLRAARPAVEPTWEAYFGCREDKLAGRKGAIQQRASALSQGAEDQGPVGNRRRAEAEALRTALLDETT